MNDDRLDRTNAWRTVPTDRADQDARPLEPLLYHELVQARLAGIPPDHGSALLAAVVASPQSGCAGGPWTRPNVPVVENVSRMRASLPCTAAGIAIEEAASAEFSD